MNENTKEKINYIKAEKFVSYKRAEEILNKMEELLAWPKQHRMPHLFVVGPENNGKTSIAKKFFKQHPPTEGIDEDAMPVVYVHAPDKPHIGLLYNRILEALIVPFRISASVAEKERDVRYYFRHCGTKMLIIDDMQKILINNYMQRRQVFIHALKGLSEMLGISLVLIGAEELFLYDVDLSDFNITNRFKPVLLPRWSFDEEYLFLLGKLEESFQLAKALNLIQDIELAQSIFDYSEGLLGKIVEITNDLAIKASENG